MKRGRCFTSAALALDACDGDGGRGGGRARTITATPAVIPLSAPELANPSRGFFRWYGGEAVPQPAPPAEHYARFNWRQLEAAEGPFDSVPADRQPQAARADGARFGLRVTAVNGHHGAVQLPEYLRGPVALAIQGRGADGAYAVAEVEVPAGARGILLPAPPRP